MFQGRNRLVQRLGRQLGRASQNVSMKENQGWVAIVDDDPSVLKALRRSLRVRAIRAQVFCSAEEFLAALPHGLPECLILDLQMPGMSGLELLQDLKRRGINIPAIVITAHGEDRVREHCESAGVVAFFSKPLERSSLFAAVQAVVGRK